MNEYAVVVGEKVIPVQAERPTFYNNFLVFEVDGVAVASFTEWQWFTTTKTPTKGKK